MLADRVLETTIVVGTGTISLLGAPTDYQSFVAGKGDGETCPYCIVFPTADEWEVGIGTITDASPDTLSRDTVLASSNAGSKVNFSAGTKSVFLCYPADLAVLGPTGGLTASRALVVHTDGTLIVSAVTSTELGYVSGVTSSIQTQIDNISSDLVDDTTPQLGGNLDGQSYDITTTGDITGSLCTVAVSTGGLASCRFVEQANLRAAFQADFNKDQLIITVGAYVGNQLVLGAYYGDTDYDHATPTHPTLFLHSITDPDTDNTQWISICHNGDDAEFGIGKGAFKFTALDISTEAGVILVGSSNSTTFSSNAPLLRLDNTNQTNNNYSGIAFGDGSSSYAGCFQGVVTDHSNNYGFFRLITRNASGLAVRATIDDNGLVLYDALRLLEKSADPTEPVEGESVVWLSDGTGKGDDGDVLIASRAGGATKWGTLFDHSAGAGW